MNAFAIIKEQYPTLSDTSIDIIINYVKEVICNFLGTEDIPTRYTNTYLMKCKGVIEANGIMQYNRFSENGLSLVFDKDFITRDLITVAKVVKIC